MSMGQALVLAGAHRSAVVEGGGVGAGGLVPPPRRPPPSTPASRPTPRPPRSNHLPTHARTPPTPGAILLLEAVVILAVPLGLGKIQVRTLFFSSASAAGPRGVLYSWLLPAL